MNDRYLKIKLAYYKLPKYLWLIFQRLLYEYSAMLPTAQTSDFVDVVFMCRIQFSERDFDIKSSMWCYIKQIYSLWYYHPHYSLVMSLNYH